MNISITFRNAGDYNFATIQTDGFISKLKASVMASKKGGYYMNCGHATKSGDKWYPQLRLAPELQGALDQVATMFCGKAEIVELVYSKTGFKITNVMEQKTGVIVNADAFADIANKEMPPKHKQVIENPEVIAGNVDEAFN